MVKTQKPQPIWSLELEERSALFRALTKYYRLEKLQTCSILDTLLRCGLLQIYNNRIVDLLPLPLPPVNLILMEIPVVHLFGLYLHVAQEKTLEERSMPRSLRLPRQSPTKIKKSRSPYRRTVLVLGMTYIDLPKLIKLYRVNVQTKLSRIEQAYAVANESALETLHISRMDLRD
jgi:hypothetical protein